MSVDVARELSEARTRRRSPRALAVSALGPLTVVAGLGWALLQPYRITLLEPREHGFWWLLVQPPLLVVAAGLFFHFVIARGVLEDLAEEEDGR
jgi:hypothetical protein